MAFVGLTLALIVTEIMRLFQGFKGINPATMTRLMNHENALVVDLRSASDFQAGHISGAKNVQMNQFDPENKLLANVKDLPIVLVCKAGNTASDAAKRLVKAGFKHVSVLDGGIGAWQSADLPLVKGRN
ncbi:rhodanese-like domain-containing protein [Lysobacter soyae]|uniref:Rhodanese-like domain-containing protein n=1 Tax=Lysobacter soyae TaxID=2764185 RepID=A0ABX8WPQ4_9GAMM|nr:rhodanese-like domain-containing protein [Lysobacter sp. CJ11]QYR53006.1 rhodanese-like domain-containing protein [Lysobacter sp. CJ11]